MNSSFWLVESEFQKQYSFIYNWKWDKLAQPMSGKEMKSCYAAIQFFNHSLICFNLKYI